MRCCSESLTVLLDIYNKVMTSCFAAAAKAVVSYTGHLKTLRDLENITEFECTTGMYRPSHGREFDIIRVNCWWGSE